MSPSGLHLDLLSGDLTAVDSDQPWRPARRPQVQMCRFHGLHLCHLQVCVCVHVNTQKAELFKHIKGFLHVFLQNNVFCVIYLPGRWILRSSIIFMTSCKTAENKGEKAHGEQQHKGGFIHKFRPLLDYFCNPIMSLPPCGCWKSFFCLLLWQILDICFCIK